MLASSLKPSVFIRVHLWSDRLGSGFQVPGSGLRARARHSCRSVSGVSGVTSTLFTFRHGAAGVLISPEALAGCRW